MSFTIEQLTNREIEINIPMAIQQTGGEFKTEDFRIVIKDLPSGEHTRLLEECRQEAARLQKEYKDNLAKYEKASKKNGKSKLEAPALAPTEQDIYHARRITRLPDLVDKDGNEIKPSVAIFQRLGANMNLAINTALWEKMLKADLSEPIKLSASKNGTSKP
jgi:hypothetical protein